MSAPRPEVSRCALSHRDYRLGVDTLTYVRATSIAEALGLMSSGRLLAGGTVVNTDRRGTVIDLQDLGLGGIESRHGRVSIGAMVRLSELASSTAVPPLIAELARRELPSTLRTQATVGGTIAMNDFESPLMAAFLAYEAQVTVATIDGERTSALWTGRPVSSLITSVTIATDGVVAFERTARTPADRPIVCAVARRHRDETRLALAGVGPTTMLVDPDNPTGGLAPPTDFRGSAAYRIELAAILSRRVLAGVR